MHIFIELFIYDWLLLYTIGMAKIEDCYLTFSRSFRDIDVNYILQEKKLISLYRDAISIERHDARRLTQE
jgi:hypothetical protein